MRRGYRKLTMVKRRSRESLIRALRLHLALFSVVIFILVCRFIDRHPFQLGFEEPVLTEGERLVGMDEGDVLLIVPTNGPREEPDSFSGIDFSANWGNILGQEIGIFRIVELPDFSPASLDSTVLVVVPRAASRLITAGQVATLESFVEMGGRLLVELPTAVWRPLTGPTADPELYRPTRRITAFDGALVRGDLRDDIIQAPLASILSPLQLGDVALFDDIDILLEVDGLPGFIRRPNGEGEVFALYFDLAQAVAAIQQGRPTADWEIPRPSAPLPSGYTRTSCLVGDSILRESETPAADLLERQLLNVVLAGRPLPRVWTFPGKATGAFVMTHSGVPSLTPGQFMFDWEAERELPVTIFASATEATLPWANVTPSAGLLLIPPDIDYAPTDSIGLFGFEPFVRPLGWGEQYDRFPTQEVVVLRIVDGLWHPQYGRTFQILAGLGVAVDSSYGPAFDPTDLEAVNGYSFGTGLPFFPIDRHGLLSSVLEIPYVLTDGAFVSYGAAEELIDRAGRVYHELVVADWRAGTMVSDPRAEIVDIWRDSFQMARSAGLWITDLAGFAQFWHYRARVRMTSEFSWRERRLSVQVDVPPPLNHNGEEVLPSIAVESHFEERGIERITRNGEDIPFVELGRTSDGVLRIVELPPGRNQLEITYQGDIELGD